MYNTLVDWYVNWYLPKETERRRLAVLVTPSGRRGRKLGDVQYPDDEKLMRILARQFRSDPQLRGLPSSRVYRAAKEAGMVTKDLDMEAITHRIRPKLKQRCPDIAVRIRGTTKSVKATYKSLADLMCYNYSSMPTNATTKSKMR